MRLSKTQIQTNHILASLFTILHDRAKGSLDPMYEEVQDIVAHLEGRPTLNRELLTDEEWLAHAKYLVIRHGKR